VYVQKCVYVQVCAAVHSVGTCMAVMYKTVNSAAAQPLSVQSVRVCAKVRVCASVRSSAKCGYLHGRDVRKSW